MARILLILSFGLLAGGSLRAAETKTDPAHDVFVENSATDFVLAVKAPQASGKNRLGFAVSAPDSGDYTVVCFIDGKSLKPTRFTSPGTFELSTRGMPPGSYRVTLQLIDSKGRVGSNTQTVRVK
jgi:hypothetical protein